MSLVYATCRYWSSSSSSSRRRRRRRRRRGGALKFTHGGMQFGTAALVFTCHNAAIFFAIKNKTKHKLGHSNWRIRQTSTFKKKNKKFVWQSISYFGQQAVSALHTAKTDIFYLSKSLSDRLRQRESKKDDAEQRRVSRRCLPDVKYLNLKSNNSF